MMSILWMTLSLMLPLLSVAQKSNPKKTRTYEEIYFDRFAQKDDTDCLVYYPQLSALGEVTRTITDQDLQSKLSTKAVSRGDFIYTVENTGQCFKKSAPIGEIQDAIRAGIQSKVLQSYDVLAIHRTGDYKAFVLKQVVLKFPLTILWLRQTQSKSGRQVQGVCFLGNRVPYQGLDYTKLCKFDDRSKLPLE